MDEENKYITPHGAPGHLVRPNGIYISGPPPLYSSYPNNSLPYYSSAPFPLPPVPPHPQFRGFIQTQNLPQSHHIQPI